MIRWFTSHPTAANLLLLVFIAVGSFSAPTLLRETFPDFRPVEAEVSVVYRGATPSDVEKKICEPLWDAVQSVESLSDFVCTAQNNLAHAVATMQPSGDAVRFVSNLKTEISAIDSFPTLAEAPVIRELHRTDLVASVAVSGELPLEQLDHYSKYLQDQLASLDTVAKVIRSGVGERTWSIQADPRVLKEYGLTTSSIANALKQQSINLPAGTLEGESGEYNIRFDTEALSKNALLNLPIVTLTNGAVINLSDIARVDEKYEPSSNAAFLDGVPVILLEVHKPLDADALRSLDDLTNTVKAEQSRGIGSIHLEVVQDVTSIIRDRLTMLVQNGVVGLVLVVLVMSLFFRPAYAAWAAMGLPVAFLGAFAWMSLTGESLNMITVVALLMAIGIVMDDSIVLSDSIAVHSHGNVTLPSVVQGVVAVAPGVVSSFLTTVSVFLPLSFLAGELGAVLEVLPVVLLASLTASLVEAFFILPHHLKQSLTKSNYSPNKFKVRFEEIFNAFKERGVGRLADWAIDHRLLVVGVAVGLLIITIGALGSGVVKREAMPEIDGDVIEARILLPMGVSLARTEEAVRQVEDALARVNIELKSKQPQQQDLVKRVITRFGRNLSVGESGSHVATVSADLLSAEIRNTTLDELIEIWKREIGVLPGITSLILTEPGIGPQGIAVELRLFHEDLDLLFRASQDLLSEVEKYQGVLNAKHDLNVGKPQLGMQITSDGQALGLTPLAIANQLRGAFLGETLDDIRVGELQYAIEVKFADDSTQDINDLLAFELQLNDGSTVLLPNVVKLYETREWSSVTQRNGARSVTIQADVDGRIANADAITADIKKTLLPNIQANYSGIAFEVAGQAANSAETVASILRGFLIGIVGVYLILSFQFRSYVEPLIVLLTIPMAFLGVVWGHNLMGYNISMPSLVGAASLSGIVVNNAILLIGVIKERVSDTKSVIDAASEAVRSRFRPIFVSVSTTIMGMAPLLTETSTQAQTLKPLVISVVFGLLASTVLVMIVVPSLYAIVNDLKSKSSTN